jgi:drug/metabolite transporter (DMT)-like permease
VALASRTGGGSGGGAAGRLAAGASYGLLAAVGFGLYYVVLRRASDAAGADPFWPVLVQRTVSTVVLGLVAAVTRPRLVMPPSAATMLALAGVLDVSANALYAAASTSGIGSLAAVLSSLFPITTVALAGVFLRERLSGGQAVGVAGALAGVVLIAWS